MDLTKYFKSYYKKSSLLSIIKRDTPKEADRFFSKLLKEELNINKKISKTNGLYDIRCILDETVSKNIKNNEFYDKWLVDMASVCEFFCNVLNENSLSYSLETSRSCKRYHIDNVPMRLLVTYYGKGTEWLPSYASNYDAYFSGKGNNKIVKIKKKEQFIDNWNIAIFRGNKNKGGEKGILHRTPDEAFYKRSLIMRLDSADYLENLI